MAKFHNIKSYLILYKLIPHSPNIRNCVKYMQEIFQKMVNVTW
jgi:hypothetical protein